MDFVLVAVGYLLGSVPFGVIAGRLFGGVDVRDFGSGKTGTANVLRTVGVWPAVAVLILDFGKGVLAVVLAGVLADSDVTQAVAGVAVILGHNWPVFIGFRGGRGASTGLGALYALSPVSGLVTTLVAAPTMGLSRYVSLGAILGALAGALTLVVLSLAGVHPVAYMWFAVPAVVIVVVRHSDNIQRLLKGEERKIGQPANGSGPRKKDGKRKGLRWSRSA